VPSGAVQRGGDDVLLHHLSRGAGVPRPRVPRRHLQLSLWVVLAGIGYDVHAVPLWERLCLDIFGPRRLRVWASVRAREHSVHRLPRGLSLPLSSVEPGRVVPCRDVLASRREPVSSMPRGVHVLHPGCESCRVWRRHVRPPGVHSVHRLPRRVLLRLVPNGRGHCYHPSDLPRGHVVPGGSVLVPAVHRWVLLLSRLDRAHPLGGSLPHGVLLPRLRVLHPQPSGADIVRSGQPWQQSGGCVVRGRVRNVSHWPHLQLGVNHRHKHSVPHGGVLSRGQLLHWNGLPFGEVQPQPVRRRLGFVPDLPRGVLLRLSHHHTTALSSGSVLPHWDDQLGGVRPSQLSGRKVWRAGTVQLGRSRRLPQLHCWVLLPR
jgi:hypothetical protein